jgi:hypothetical protein
MDQQKKNHRIILVILAMSVIPLLLALLLLDTGTFISKTRNYGQFITPVITTNPGEFTGADKFSKQHINELAGHWLLVNVIPTEKCNAVCLKAILETRQLRLMLNRDLPRTRRVVLLLNQSDQDTSQWWIKDSFLWTLNAEKGKSQEEKNRDNALYAKYLLEDNNVDEMVNEIFINSKMKSPKSVAEIKKELLDTSDLIRLMPDSTLKKRIIARQNGKVLDGMLFLIDPLGNIMMQYEPGFDPYKVKEDLMLLLKASQIG